jgi:methionyl-tRNA formyltransferase
MRLVFAGTPQFAAVILTRLVQCGHDLRLVLTQPDRDAGRGLRVAQSAVKQVAGECGIAVQQPVSLRDPRVADTLPRDAEAWVVAAYGLILPPHVLAIPPLGCLNVHASLLPRWRGAAPIQRAILAGDAETGVCIMRMEAGLDTGPVYVSRRTPISPLDTAGTLHDRLAQLGADAICAVLEQLGGGGGEPVPQPSGGVTYASKIERAETRVQWARPAVELERLLRAFDPAPGAFTVHRGTDLKLFRGEVRSREVEALPGTVVEASETGLVVRCLDHDLVIGEMQRPGGRRLPAREFLRGYPIAPGTRLSH